MTAPFSSGISVTSHSIRLHHKRITYNAVASTLPVVTSKNELLADVFYTYYYRTNGHRSSERPIVFLFNGGPGSASIWLHMGGYAGPVMAKLDDEGYTIQPYGYVTNSNSILDIADLVFVDPVKTGYSRLIGNTSDEDPRIFSQKGDIEYLSRWIKLFLTQYNRWLSPKYLVGESYGTTRVAGMAWELQNKHHIFLNGVVLVSANGLNLHNFTFNQSVNAANRLLFYTTCSYKQGLLSREFQNEDISKVLNKCASFVYDNLMPSLIRIGELGYAKRDSLAIEYSKFSAIPKDLILENNFSIDSFLYYWKVAKSDYNLSTSYPDDIKLQNLIDFPTSGIAAWYHKLLPTQYQNWPLDSLLNEFKNFTVEKLIPAYYRDKFTGSSKSREVMLKISDYLGIPCEQLLKFRDLDELLSSGIYDLITGFRDRQVSVIDARITGGLDMAAFSQAFVPALNHYLKKELKCKTTRDYCTNTKAISDWWFRQNIDGEKAGTDLYLAMKQNSFMKVLFQSGYYDRNCPFMLNQYQKWQLDPSSTMQNRILIKGYQAGHMMYIKKSERVAANNDLRNFIISSLPPQVQL